MVKTWYSSTPIVQNPRFAIIALVIYLNISKHVDREFKEIASLAT